jgi:hypothetical protein
MTEPMNSPDDLGRLVPPVALDMFLSIPDSQTFAMAAREWLASLPGLLAPREWAEVLRERKPPFSGSPMPKFSSDVLEEPFMAWGHVVVAPLKWNGMRVWQRRVTSTTLEWLAEVLADRPVSARIVIKWVDANGVELPGAVAVSAEAALGPSGEPIPVGRLTAGDDLMRRAGGQSRDLDGLRDQLVSVARAWAGRPGALGLFAGEDTGTAHGTALRHGLTPLLHWDQVALTQEREQELQGYSWVTLVPAGAVARLGGAVVLTGSGAFWRVEELPTGGVLVQATERLGEYDLAAAHRVWEVLAPVLPAGVPRRPANWSDDVPWLVIPQDAASRR